MQCICACALYWYDSKQLKLIKINPLLPGRPSRVSVHHRRWRCRCALRFRGELVHNEQAVPTELDDAPAARHLQVTHGVSASTEDHLPRIPVTHDNLLWVIAAKTRIFLHFKFFFRFEWTTFRVAQHILPVVADSHARTRTRTQIWRGFPIATVVRCINFTLHIFGLGSQSPMVVLGSESQSESESANVNQP